MKNVFIRERHEIVPSKVVICDVRRILQGRMQGCDIGKCASRKTSKLVNCGVLHMRTTNDARWRQWKMCLLGAS